MKTETKQVKVRETYMDDGVDLIHTFSTVQEALDSGRFEYIEEDLTEYKSVEELIAHVGYPFSIED